MNSKLLRLLRVLYLISSMSAYSSLLFFKSFCRFCMSFLYPLICLLIIVICFSYVLIKSSLFFICACRSSISFRVACLFFDVFFSRFCDVFISDCNLFTLLSNSLTVCALVTIENNSSNIVNIILCETFIVIF